MINNLLYQQGESLGDFHFVQWEGFVFVEQLVKSGDLFLWQTGHDHTQLEGAITKGVINGA